MSDENGQMDIEQRWEIVTEGEFLKFERVENKRSDRPDLHAFLLLDSLFPGTSDMVSCAEHDEIWLDVAGDQIEILTDDQMRELARCGVRYDADSDSLCMFA